MALADTGEAIGSVSNALKDLLVSRTDLDITIGRPEPQTETSNLNALNLFLYEAAFDPSLKNINLDDGRPAPLWLVLKYLLTAYDERGKSDTMGAHKNLGIGARVIHAGNYLRQPENPEPIKVTFDEAPSELLSRLMQGTDEKYRFSLAFQVRPVMIASAEEPSSALLVGVDYTRTPPDNVIGEEGIKIPVIAGRFPEIFNISPARFQVDEDVELEGENLDVEGLSVILGEITIPVRSQRADKVGFRVDKTLAKDLSAGSYPVCVAYRLPTGRFRKSNILVGRLMPFFKDAVSMDVKRESTTSPNVYGKIEITGLFFGHKEDDIFVALYRDGKTFRVLGWEFDSAVFESALPESKIVVNMAIEDAVPHGKYRLILRVNGQQAKEMHFVDLIAP